MEEEVEERRVILPWSGVDGEWVWVCGVRELRGSLFLVNIGRRKQA